MRKNVALILTICWEILGATSHVQCNNKKNKIKSLIFQKDVHRRAKIGAQNLQNKLHIEYIVLPREIVYPYFLVDL